MQEDQLVVYKITFPKCPDARNGYIGMTKRGKTRRINQHINNAGNNRNKSPHIENAIRKYGADEMHVEVLAICETFDELKQKEVEMIALHQTLNPLGYNLTIGGDGNSKPHTEEYKLAKSQHMRVYKADEDLEMYVRYIKTKNGAEGYGVRKPGTKTAQFTSPDLTMDEKRELANACAREIAAGEIKEVNRYKHVDIGIEDIPKGISYLSKFDGFRVTVPGHPIKWFKSSKLTRVEKYQLAITYYNSVKK
jgi:hypothetical protein